MPQISRRLIACTSLAILCAVHSADAQPDRGGIVATANLAAGKHLLQILVDHQKANPEIVGEAITVTTPEWSWSGATGAVPGSSERLTERHLFRIASVTKPFVAASILRLMEMGKLDITRPIYAYVSADTNRRLRGGGYDPTAITVRQLMSHTSGLCNFGDSPEFAESVKRDSHHHWTRGEQIQFAVDHCEPAGAPGSVFAYSDTGYIILGEIIERATGNALGPAVRHLIDYKAIGLVDTYWEQMERQPRPGAFSGAMLSNIDMTHHDHSFDLYGGGGLISTTGDLARFFRALFEGHIFKRPNTLAALLNVPAAKRTEGLPLLANGVTLYPVGRFNCIGHHGFWGQLVVYCPENRVAIAWSTNNSSHATNGANVTQEIAAALGMQ